MTDRRAAGPGQPSRRGAAGHALVAGLALLTLTGSASALAGCEGPLALQVLGSGGPTLDARRASASHLLWVDGHARVLLDAGSGSFTRFGSAGARLEDLWLIALSHLHVDHAVDLPAYVKGGYFSGRDRALPIAGPDGRGDFPATAVFMRRLFDPDEGAYAYLGGTLDGSEGQFETPVIGLDAASEATQPVYRIHGLRISAHAVSHGPVPTLAYRLEIDGRVIVYGADQNGDDAGFVDFARGADLLIMPLAIPEDAGVTAQRLHARPSEVARIARDSGARRLLLSHLMPRSERVLERALARIRRAYDGPVQVAEDLMCLRLGTDAPEDL